jgi:hypothetical protein
MKPDLSEVLRALRRPVHTRAYDIIVPFSEVKKGKEYEYRTVAHVIAQDLEDAIRQACNQVSQSCFSARLRGEIISWYVDRKAAYQKSA